MIVFDALAAVLALAAVGAGGDQQVLQLTATRGDVVGRHEDAGVGDRRDERVVVRAGRPVR